MPSDERDDETQAMSLDEETRALSPVDEPTRMMPCADEATRRMDVPAPHDPPPTRRIGRGKTPYQATPTELLHVAAKRPVTAWLIATVVTIALIAGGVIGYAQRRPSDANVVARALVSADGGVMTFDGKGRLTVPRGALPTPTAITIRRDTIDQRVRLGAEGDPRSVTYDPGELVVYAFEPADLRFQQPVKIELPRAGIGSAVFVDARGSPRVIPGDASGDTVKIETTSFSFDPASSAVAVTGSGT